MRLAAAVFAAVALISAGVAIDGRLTGPAGEGVPVDPAGVAMTAEGAGGTARLSVTVGDRPGGAGPAAAVRAVVTGLVQGVEYRLLAVADGATTYEVTRWTATAGAQEVAGEVPAPVDSLAFFAVTEADGTAVVSAKLER